jgi:hypothetical protein
MIKWILLVLISIIILSLLLKVNITDDVENFGNYNEYKMSIDSTIGRLRFKNKKYMSKYEMINEILFILNCKKLGDHDFNVVNIDMPKDGDDFSVMFYDKKTASVLNIVFESRFVSEQDEKGKLQSFYLLTDISVLSDITNTDDKTFYDEHFEKNPYPF